MDSGKVSMDNIPLSRRDVSELHGLGLSEHIVFTRRQAAALATLGLNSLDELIKQQAFPVVRVGRRVLIPLVPFVEFLRGKPKDVG